jgi:hypothetical protein
MATAMASGCGFVVGVTHNLALRRSAGAVASLVRGTNSRWGGETWPCHR